MFPPKFLNLDGINPSFLGLDMQCQTLPLNIHFQPPIPQKRDVLRIATKIAACWGTVLRQEGLPQCATQLWWGSWTLCRKLRKLVWRVAGGGKSSRYREEEEEEEEEPEEEEEQWTVISRALCQRQVTQRTFD